MIRVNFSKCLFHDCSMHGVKIKPVASKMDKRINK